MNHAKNVQEEFATIDLLLPSNTLTGRTDAFILAWVKIEKQIRRIFTYVVYQSPAFSSKDDIIKIIASNPRLYFENFVKGFDALYPTPFDQIIGSRYAKFMKDFARIKKYRNKILHGQLTGLALDAAKLTTEVELMREWVSLVAEKMCAEIGYDGVEPNAFRKSNVKNFSSRYNRNIQDAKDLKSFVAQFM